MAEIQQTGSERPPGATDVKSPEAEQRPNQINTGQYKNLESNSSSVFYNMKVLFEIV